MLAWAIWLIREVLPPFLVSVALALLLDPLLDRMEARGMRRAAAVALVFSLLLGVFFGLLAYVVPLAIGQVSDLLQNLSSYGTRLEAPLRNWLVEHEEQLRRLNLPVSVTELQQQYGSQVVSAVQGLLRNLFTTLQASAGALGWAVIVPIVTLYLMLDLDRMRERVFHLVPAHRRDTVMSLVSRVGDVFTAYLRGLTAICCCFGLTLYLVLGLGFRLPYALILGLVAAVLYAVPYLGQLALLLAAVAVSWATGHALPYVGGVAIAVVAVGQLYDQLITPRVIGRQVGIHPVLGLFALTVGGHLFGLGGMVVAVPVAASVRVVLIHLFPRLVEPLPSEVYGAGKVGREGEYPHPGPDTATGSTGADRSSGGETEGRPPGYPDRAAGD